MCGAEVIGRVDVGVAVFFGHGARIVSVDVNVKRGLRGGNR